MRLRSDSFVCTVFVLRVVRVVSKTNLSVIMEMLPKRNGKTKIQSKPIQSGPRRGELVASLAQIELRAVSWQSGGRSNNRSPAVPRSASPGS